MRTIEQAVRDILEQAVKDGLVALAPLDWADPDPQCRSSGELAGCSEILAEFIRTSEVVTAGFPRPT